MTMLGELKPCPFCGEHCANLVIDQGDKWAHYEPGCLEVRTGYNTAQDAPWRKEAVAAWNTRDTREIDRAKAEGWKPIETAPKSHRMILLLDLAQCDPPEVHASAVCAGYWADIGMFDEAGKEGWINFWASDPDADQWETFSATHWMPLPSPPSIEG